MRHVDKIKSMLLEKRAQLINQLDHLNNSSFQSSTIAIKDYILKKRKQLIKIDQTLSLLHQKKVENTKPKSQEGSRLN